MLLAFPLGVAVSVLAGAPLGWPWWVPFLGAATAFAVSLGFYRRSRSLFYAFDWLLDPEDPPGPGGWEGDGGGAPDPEEGPPSLWAIPDPRVGPTPPRAVARERRPRV